DLIVGGNALATVATPDQTAEARRRTPTRRIHWRCQRKASPRTGLQGLWSGGRGFESHRSHHRSHTIAHTPSLTHHRSHTIAPTRPSKPSARALAAPAC